MRCKLLRLVLTSKFVYHGCNALTAPRAKTCISDASPHNQARPRPCQCCHVHVLQDRHLCLNQHCVEWSGSAQPTSASSLLEQYVGYSNALAKTSFSTTYTAMLLGHVFEVQRAASWWTRYGRFDRRCRSPRPMMISGRSLTLEQKVGQV